MERCFRVAEGSGEGRDEVWIDGPRRRPPRKCVRSLVLLN